jgi:hypothetical protein
MELEPNNPITGGLATQVTAGKGLTVRRALAVPEHPPFEQVTPYIVVEAGLTVMYEDVEPLLHRKLVPPLAVKVAVAPAQIEGGETTTFTAGAVRTLTTDIALAEQPFAFIPVTK